MPDEVISFEIDNRSVLAAIAQSNQALEKFEGKAGSAGKAVQDSFQRMADLLLKVNDRSHASNERLTQSIERQAAAYNRSGLEKLIAARDLHIKKLGDEQMMVDRVRASYDKMIEAERGKGEGLSSFGERIKQFIEAPLQSASMALTKLGAGFGPTGALATSGAIALGAIATAAYEAAKSLGELGVREKDVELRTGLVGKEVAQFSFAAKAVGQDITIMDRLMKGLTTTLADNAAEGEKARRALSETLKINPIDLQGGIRPTKELLVNISESLERMPDQWSRNKAAMDLFKRSGIEAVPFMLELSKNVKEAEDHGFGRGPEQIEAFARYHKDLALISTEWDELAIKFKEPLVRYILTYFKGGEHREITGLAKGTPLAYEGYETLDLIAPSGAPHPSHGVGPGMPYVSGSVNQITSDAAARFQSSLAGSGNSLEQAQRRLHELKNWFDEAATAADRLKLSTQLDPKVASDTLNHLEATRKSYQAQEETVKLLQKRESERVAVLEKIANLNMGGMPFYKIGSGGGPLGAIVTQQELSDANPLPIQGQRIPSLLRGRGPLNPDELEAIRALQQQPGGGVGGVFVSPERVRSGQYDQTEAEANRAFTGSLGNPAQERLAAISAEALMIERIVSLRTGPGGELAEARTVAGIRQTALAEEFLITGDITRLREGSLRNQVELTTRVAEIQQQQFKSVSNAAGGLFNTLFTNPKGFGRQLGSTISGATLKPITEGLGNMTAQFLTPLIFGAGGGGGIAGGLRGAFGGGEPGIRENTGAVGRLTGAIYNLTSVMSGGSASSWTGGSMLGGGFSGGGGISGGSGASLGDVAGGGLMGLGGGLIPGLGPGGTAPFMRGTGGGGFNLGGLLGRRGGLSLSGLRSSFFNSGSIATGAGTATTAAGIGGWQGTAAGILTSPGAASLELAGGLPLAMAGLTGQRRGTWGGIAESTGGGALIGAGIGTMVLPGIGTAIGAGIGAAVGFGVGFAEKLFGVESQRNEAIKLARQMYGVTINNQTADQIVQIAKQKYANQVSLAVRDPDVRKMIELYSAATGQRIPMSASTPHAGSLAEQGDQLYQQSTYQFGNPYAYQSSLPILGGGSGVGTYPNGPISLSLSVDGRGASDFIAGNVVTPGLVQARWSQAGDASDGRVANSAMIQQPGLVTSS